MLSKYEETLLEGWEDVHKRGQLTLWILLALKDGPKHMQKIKRFISDITSMSISADDKSMYRALRRFADAEIATLSDDELAQLEHLIEMPDPDLYAALTGNVALEPEYTSRLFDRIQSFRVADHDA